ncbi:MAG: cob(I)yrinic acid a,c-diamide adenosyltransferase [Actinomycetota bacterium]
MKIYTRAGDDGTTGLLYGGRVRKDAGPIEVNGAVDEAQAFLGAARAEAGVDHPLAETILGLERDLWVLMAEVATSPENRSKLTPGASMVTDDMVTALESAIDAIMAVTQMPTEFVVPGENRLAATLDVARTVVRRAERLAVTAGLESSLVVAYLNRLSDLCWAMARSAAGASTPVRSLGKRS